MGGRGKVYPKQQKNLILNFTPPKWKSMDALALDVFILSKRQNKRYDSKEKTGIVFI